MKKLLKALALLAVMLSATATAQQAQQFEDYSIHYNALSSSLISFTVFMEDRNA